MLTLALRIWFVLPSAAGLETGTWMVAASDFQSLVGNSRGGSEPNPLRCCAGFTAALTAAPSFRTPKTHAHTPEACLIVQKPALPKP
jgi:hypothetical protein